MKILGLELSSPLGSIAWQEDAQEPFSTSFSNDRKHSGLFFENLQFCLERFGKPDRIIVGLGPGSYAGTRIAIAAATGLAATTGAQLRGVPSFCAMETDANEYAVIGDARRHSFYLALVRARRSIEGPVLYAEHELVERLHQMHVPVLATEPLAPFPRAQVAHPSAFLLMNIEGSDASLPLEPIYLRDPHITYPKNGTILSNAS